MENEIIWMPIPGYHNYYEISQEGTVRGLNRVIQSGTGQIRTIKGQIIKPKNNGLNYQFVTLCRDGRTRNHYVHRLVATTFLPNVKNLTHVNHSDGNPQNNDISNLEWVNHRDNVKHAYREGFNTNCGDQHHASVKVVNRATGEIFHTIREFCEHYNLNYSTGRNFLNGYSSLKRTINLSVTNFKKVSNEAVSSPE